MVPLDAQRLSPSIHTFSGENRSGLLFIQQETLTGLGLFLMNVNAVLPGYQAMNDALNGRAKTGFLQNK